MRRWLYLLLAIGVVAIVVVGLNQAADTRPKAQKSPPFDLDRALASLEGAPPALASLHDQAAELLPDDVKAFRARLESLRGYPIVINKWGSWCGPCRSEFPVFQRVGAALGKKVAFVGIDGSDPEDAAREFLEEFPVPYPSYRDESGTTLSGVVDAGTFFPTTVFVDRNGKVVIAKQGEYVRDEQLRADIRKYLGV
jgi:cytochrome c biogenesis protein CcmG/thiol:disulfide interchange protein DsbE